VVTNIRELVELHEGRVHHAYQDSLGFWTIGVGHLIDPRRGGKLPDKIIDDLLDYDIEAHAKELFAALPWAKDLDPVRQAVMIDMTFNLGIYGLLGFRNTLRAIKEQRWEDAAKGMLASKWAGQVGSRAVRLADMMRTGQWPAVFVGPY
jgi:lysozyme